MKNKPKQCEQCKQFTLVIKKKIKDPIGKALGLWNEISEYWCINPKCKWYKN